LYLTIPNLLTLLRILIVPVFAILVMYGHLVAAFALFVLAALTDLLDGYIARRLNQASSLGAFLDPMADKLLMLVAFVLLGTSRHVALHIPPWLMILAITRDVIIGLFALHAYPNYDASNFRPSLLGKATAIVEMVVVSLTLLYNATAASQAAGAASRAHWAAPLGLFVPWSFYAVAFFVIVSGVHYFARATGSQKA
jgi:cardiolipin synthase